MKIYLNEYYWNAKWIWKSHNDVIKIIIVDFLKTKLSKDKKERKISSHNEVIILLIILKQK